MDKKQNHSDDPSCASCCYMYSVQDSIKSVLLTLNHLHMGGSKGESIKHLVSVKNRAQLVSPPYTMPPRETRAARET